jgi:tetratricopeptide (TPR) repeat protein
MSSSNTGEQSGTLAAALTHAQHLLVDQPELAAVQAEEILKVVPAHPLAALLLGQARRALGDSAGALRVLRELATAQPRASAVHYELGLTLRDCNQNAAAAAALRRAVALKPDLSDGWRQLGDQLMLAGDLRGADDAYAQHLKASTKDPQLMAAAAALCDNQLAVAERLLRDQLKQRPTDVAAIRMLAEVAGRLGRYQDAESLLVRCLELAPGFDGARYNYAIVLNRQRKAVEALGEVEKLLLREPRNSGYRNLKAVVLGGIGEYEQAIEIYGQVLANHPRQHAIWMSYGHALGTAGREQDSVAAYRRCIDLAPQCGEAYWSLANLKTFSFSDAELQAMQAQLARTDLSREDRLHFHFATGKAYEDQRDYATAFDHYQSGNSLHRANLDYDANDASALVRRSKLLLSRDFFAQRTDFGSPARDPIFVVGLPRAGSTLIEQILASHSAVEGTMELPDIMALSRSLGGRKSDADSDRYPAVLAALDTAQCRSLGEEYLKRTRIQRKLGRPFFIDKMPNNFLHIGLIRLILPKAKIIDARRHPLACCFSGFKQHFARGQHFTYSLEDIGRYYQDYVELMSHYDAVLPGVVHRVHYENLVDDPEVEIRRLLDYCALDFEPGCLRFHENSRAVRTASSQQVRQPIFRSGVDHWRHFEPWLGPLKDALGSTLTEYPRSPFD